MNTVRARGLGIAFAVCGLAGFAGFAHAQSQSPSPCASITDDKSRLQCYDAEAALRKSQPTARPAAPAPAPDAGAAATRTPAPSAAPAAVPMPAPAARSAETAPAQASAGSASDFGSETLPNRGKKPTDPEQPSELTAKVASVAGPRKGEYRVTLDNGQVWEETQRTGGEPPEVGDTVILRRGAMGSYFLSHGKGLALRVRRVK